MQGPTLYSRRSDARHASERFENRGSWTALIGALLLLPVLALAQADGAADARVRLSGHVLDALGAATVEPAGSLAKDGRVASEEDQPLSLTVVLKRDDEAGFQQYLHDVHDPQSPVFRQFLSQPELATRFGPSAADYRQVLDYLQTQGFQLAEGSANRLTLTVSGTRAQAEQAFDVHIGDYRIGDRTFYANDRDPSLPGAIAVHVQAISGLSDLARPQPSIQAIRHAICFLAVSLNVYFNRPGGTLEQQQAEAQRKVDACVAHVSDTHAQQSYFFTDPPPPAWQGADGTGQTIGLLEFDTFELSDIADYISLIGLPDSKINDVTETDVNGGFGGPPGAGMVEVLLDIDEVLNVAPGAAIAVYDGPSGTSFQAMFNALIDGDVDIISNSWAYCEDQTTLADVTSIDSILQGAAASGISVFNGSGDSGSSCLDGSANTVAVPADVPSATAVGGSSLNVGPGDIWAGETWWNGTNDTPQTGQGGFGASRYFARPAYQDGHTTSLTRSVPDVVANADPAGGIEICNANAGGCPTGTLNGGTSLAAPEWAAFTALLKQTQGSALGALNPLIYPFAGPGAFHDAAAMGSDFAHVGLGSPKLALLHQQLTGQTAGPIDPMLSQVRVYDVEGFSFPPTFSLVLPQFADGTPSYVAVRLVDANANILIGKTVTLTANPGSHATISPASGVTTSDNGAVVFTVTDLTVEPLTFTATDTTDGVTLDETASLNIIPPIAASGSISAFTDAVPADGASSDIITVTLQDAMGRPSPGKIVTLAQTGNSVISGPSPNVTDSNGEIEFTVTDTVQESITYTATDVTDGDLPVPGSAVVNFNFDGGDNCGITNLGNPDISAGPGYAITPFAIGFVPLITNFAGLNDGCRGASGLAFDALGNLYVSDMHSGNIYKFGSAGGVAGPDTLVTPTPLGPFLEDLTFGLDGKLYGSQNATTGNFFTGAVIEIDPVTGALIRTVAPSITCASFVKTDPISGDLFVNDSCSGGGSDNGSVWRISDPGSAMPTTSVYTATPGVNGGLFIAPSGTLYMLSYVENNGQAGVVSITGTNSPMPGQITVLPGITYPDLGIAALGSQGSADEQAIVLATSPPNSNDLPLGIHSYDITTDPATTTGLQIANGYANVQVIGPDGCMYVSMNVAVYKITNADGSCPLDVADSLIALSPSVVSPNPTQGSEQTFTAAIHNAGVAAGTPVGFQISGANAQTAQVNADADGTAAFTYTGVNAGSDTIVALATVNGVALASSPAHVTWSQGPHTTSLNLNTTPAGGFAGRPVTLTAGLLDISVVPNAPISGATIGFAVDGQSCSGVTAGNGVASCTLTVPDVGAFTLTVTYGGGGNFLPAMASQVFSTALLSDVIFANGFEVAP
ncbi:MAG: protease pro-enzyme activation domain-containing protein [Rhodanobacteraceae bacterium]